MPAVQMTEVQGSPKGGLPGKGQLRQRHAQLLSNGLELVHLVQVLLRQLLLPQALHARAPRAWQKARHIPLYLGATHSIPKHQSIEFRASFFGTGSFSHGRACAHRTLWHSTPYILIPRSHAFHPAH